MLGQDEVPPWRARRQGLQERSKECWEQDGLVLTRVKVWREGAAEGSTKERQIARP